MKLVQQALALTALSLALTAQAESDINSGAAAGLNAATRLDFRVAVPRMIFLRIGSGVNFADNATINRVTFAVTPANVGSGVAVLGVPSAGAVQARVLSNGGNVSFTARGVLGGLASGPRRVAWSQIVPLASGGALPHPAIGNGVAGVASALVPVSGVVNQTAVFSFNYANSSPVASGTYNGRVTYTAALP